jgi:hypothetical protein
MCSENEVFTRGIYRRMKLDTSEAQEAEQLSVKITQASETESGSQSGQGTMFSVIKKPGLIDVRADVDPSGEKCGRPRAGKKQTSGQSS